jgi:hypothetical protein
MSGNKNNIPSRSNLAPFQSHSHRLAHPAFDPITVHGVSETPSNGETETTVSQTVGLDRENQKRVGPSAALTPHAGRSPIYTVKRWRPFCRRALRTRRPPLVFILARKPCTRLRRRTLGCHVRFGITVPLQSGLRLAIIPSFLATCKFPGRHEIRNCQACSGNRWARRGHRARQCGNRWTLPALYRLTCIL